MIKKNTMKRCDTIQQKKRIHQEERKLYEIIRQNNLKEERNKLLKHYIQDMILNVASDT